MTQPAPDLISVAEAARLLGMTPGGVAHAIARGSLRAVPVPGAGALKGGRRTRLVCRADVARYQQARLAAAAAMLAGEPVTRARNVPETATE